MKVKSSHIIYTKVVMWKNTNIIIYIYTSDVIAKLDVAIAKKS